MKKTMIIALVLLAAGLLFSLFFEQESIQSSVVASPVYNGDTLIIDLGGGVAMEMVKIPAGTFQMGGTTVTGFAHERPVKTVTFDKDFYIGKYEVTQEQWRVVMGTNPSHFKGRNLPVENVSWNDCQAFCRAARRKTGCPLRLPSEAEWEYACRAGSSSVYCFGGDMAFLRKYAWYREDAEKENQTHEVGGKLPNAFGLYDMHGNVFEWCEDIWKVDDDNTSSTDVPTWASQEKNIYRVLRGGGWNSNAFDCQATIRESGIPDGRGWADGFRCAFGAS